MSLAEHRVLTEVGLSEAEWMVLLTTGYYMPFARERFIAQAVWESVESVTEEQVAVALDRCLREGWVRLVDKGHVVQRQDRYTGEPTGEKFTHPEPGIVLTERGWELHRKMCVGLREEQRKRREEIAKDEEGRQ